jgi:hypothetical protein
MMAMSDDDDRYGMGCPDYGDEDSYGEVEEYD